MERDSNKRYFKWGLTALGVICISVVLVVIFTDLPGFFGGGSGAVVGNQDLGAPHEASRPFCRGVGIRFLFDCSTNCFGLNNGMVAMDRRYCVRLDV